MTGEEPAPMQVERFRSSDVQIVKGYHVSCGICGCDVAEYSGHGVPTRAEAEEERQAHIRLHRTGRG